jgi:hypothetical protein
MAKFAIKALVVTALVCLVFDVSIENGNAYTNHRILYYISAITVIIIAVHDYIIMFRFIDERIIINAPI